MGRRYQGRIIASAILISIAASLFVANVALARHAFIVWVDGLVRRVEPKYREMSILNYQTGSVT